MSTPSYDKVDYRLRPAKQVERRMFLDAFQRMIQSGFYLRKYMYIGFGAVYFYDFRLFHKILGINRMLSVEHNRNDENRIKFNRPFAMLNIKIAEVGDVIQELSMDDKYILWLDYDLPINSTITSDLYQTGVSLSKGSIIIVTVDLGNMSDSPNDANKVREYLFEEAGHLCDGRRKEDFAASALPKTVGEILTAAIRLGLVGRSVEYQQLFNFVYKDTTEMLTIGGVICGNEEKTKLKGLDTDGANYFRMQESKQPYIIRVPLFTRKERSIIDSGEGYDEELVKEIFHGKDEEVKAYKEIYRYLPAYAELLL